MSSFKSKFGINFKSVNCPKCNKKQPKVRIPKDINETLWGGWTCQDCGCKIDKFGKEKK